MPKGSGKPIPKVEVIKTFSPQLLNILRKRFEDNMARHEGIEWSQVQSKLEKNSEKLGSLNAMEATKGEPDIVGYDKKTDEYIFMDCSSESPERRSICYDGEGEEVRNNKGVFPGGNAVDLAKAMGIELLDKEQYIDLQKLGEFDTKTSSWIKTPEKIRKLGGALFCDRRYDTVFVYHNGAESFYSARGFRGLLRV